MFEPCLCGSFDCPSCGPLQGVEQRKHYALGSLDAEDIDILNEGSAMPQTILPRDDDTQPMTVGGKRVVLLTSESGTYREWDVTVAGIQHAVIDDDGSWSLMVYVPTCLEWLDVPGMDVDTFLAMHQLILAA